MAEERSVGQLVADASREISELVKHEVALAKAEIRGDVVKGVVAGGLFGVAGYLALLATVILAVAAGFGLEAAGLPAWAAFLVLAVILLVIAGILGLIGFLNVKKIKPPQRTIRTTQRTIATVRRGSSATRP